MPGAGPVLTYMRTLSDDTARINNDFMLLRKYRGWRTLGIGEQHATVLVSLGGKPEPWTGGSLGLGHGC